LGKKLTEVGSRVVVLRVAVLRVVRQTIGAVFGRRRGVCKLEVFAALTSDDERIKAWLESCYKQL